MSAQPSRCSHGVLFNIDCAACDASTSDTAPEATSADANATPVPAADDAASDAWPDYDDAGPPDPAPPTTGPRSKERRFYRGDDVELVDALLDDLGDAPLTYDEGDVYRYEADRGVWRVMPEHELRTHFQRYAGCPKETAKGWVGLRVDASRTKGAVQAMQDRLKSTEGRYSFKAAPHGVAFADCYVRVRDGCIERLPHAPEHMARFAYPFAYDPRARHPRLDAHFDAVFGDVSEEERSDRVMMIFEHLGACLIGEATRYGKSLIFVSKDSGGGEGKSTTLKILRAVFPPGTVAALPPDKWGVHFQLKALIGKLANFVDELPRADVQATEVFKKIITGEPAYTDVKFHDGVDFDPIAGHIFSCNEPPGSDDLTEGFWRRLAPIVFGRQMHVAADHRVDAHADIVANELPGIVAAALEGAARLQTAGKFTTPGGTLAALEEWKRDANHVLAYLLENPPAERIKATDLYKNFREWARERGYREMSQTKFGRRVVATRLLTRVKDAVGWWYVPAPNGGRRG